MATPADDARKKGVAYLLANQNGDGSFKGVEGLEAQTTSAAVDALNQAGVKRGESYAGAIAWLSNAETDSTDSQARIVATLWDAGLNISAKANRLSDSRNVLSGWGAYAGFSSSFPDTPLAILALHFSASDPRLAGPLCAVLGAQRADYSWPYHGASASTLPAGFSAGAIVPTAYALIALNAYAAQVPSVTCNSTTYNLASAVNNGVTWLLSKRNTSDGGFGNAGTSTVLETALVYRLLNSLSAPPQPATSAALTYLFSQQATNGSWNGDVFQTAVALKTLPAVTMADTDKDGIPDDSESILGKNPAVADSRDLMPGNGFGGIGLTAPAIATSGTTYQFLMFSMSASGGTPPYRYRLFSGGLPNGIQLSADGKISGTPTQFGDFDFDYAVVDATGVEIHRIGRLTIVEAAAPPGYGDVPTLPEWSAICLGAFLAYAIANRRALAGASSRR